MNLKKTTKISGFSIAACVFCVFTFQTEVFAMSFFGLKLCVFSAVDGTVAKEGKPILNALVKRTYKWDGEDFTDEVTTDKDGKFSFDSQFQKSLFAIFPHNPSVSQRIKIYIEDKEYLAWAYAKGNYDVNGELNGKPLNMYCDVNSPQEKHQLENHKMYSGICELR
jgi:hypothetical protein